MNIEVEPLNIMRVGQGLVVRTDDELEIQYSSPGISPISGAQRKRWSTTSASLMDDQDDEEDADDERIVEPGLERISDDEGTNSTRSVESKDDMSDSEQSKLGFLKKSYSPEDDFVSRMHPEVLEEFEEPEASSLATLFSDNISGMATYLCPSTFEKDADDVMMQTTKTLSTCKKWDHKRHGSETDSFQQMVSSGPCGTTSSLFNSSIASVDTESDHHAKGSHAPPAPQQPSGPCSDVSILELKQHLIYDISQILGSTMESSENWMCTGEGWLVAPLSRSSGQKRVRNRCALPHAQSRRIRQLWYQWHSHSDSIKGMHNHQSQSHAFKSFDDSDVPPDRSAPPVEFVDLYYDSDPEIFTTTHKSRMKRNNSPETIDANASFGSVVHSPPPAPTAVRRTRGFSFDNRSSLTIKSFDTTPSVDDDESHQHFDLWDDRTVKEFVREHTLGKINLVWHTSTKGDDNLSNTSSSQVGSPVSVQGWFETGSRLQNSLIHPKFMWRETYQPDINNRKLSMSCRAPAYLDLLTMIRIVKPVDIDRTAYPYAKPDHSFTIKNHGGEVYLFEAKSTRERDRFVHGLKLLVARLASMIIVGDDQMFLEFFSPWAPSPVLKQF